MPARENLDNLVWVINCNLQRLDGPVRGNGKIIQELEGALPRRRLERHQGHLGLGLGSDLLQATEAGFLLKRMEEAVDGEFQKYSVEPGSYIRKHFFGKYPELLELVNHLSDDQLAQVAAGRA